MSVFDSKIFNGEVFGSYVDRVPRVKQNALVNAGVFRTRNDLRAMFGAQAGGNFATVPLYGLLDGEPVNYDGGTNITNTSTKTYSQSMIVVGRAKAWKERDFSDDITGANYMENIAAQVADYWDDVDQDTLLAILKGVFAMTGNNGFADKHTLDITGEANAMVNAATLNTATQKAVGANKGIFRVALMHSVVATNLENLQLLEYLKYTDASGMKRDLTMGTWNGRTVLVDDDMPAATGYYKTTESGHAGALKVIADSGTVSGAQIKLATVKAAEFYPADVAVDDYVYLGEKYTTYLLGDGAFTYSDVGAKVPYEVSRDPATNGGENLLYTRQRKIFAPMGISFVQPASAIISPTNAELATGARLALVKDAAGTSFINHKAIPIARIVSQG